MFSQKPILHHELSAATQTLLVVNASSIISPLQPARGLSIAPRSELKQLWTRLGGWNCVVLNCSSAICPSRWTVQRLRGGFVSQMFSNLCVSDQINLSVISIDRRSDCQPVSRCGSFFCRCCCLFVCLFSLFILLFFGGWGWGGGVTFFSAKIPPPHVP